MSGSHHVSPRVYYEGGNVSRASHSEPRQSAGTRDNQAQYHHVDRSPYYISPTTNGGSSQPQQNSNSSYHAASSFNDRASQTYNPMQRWERETMRDQPYNRVQSVRADTRLTHSQANGGSHGSNIWGSTSAQKGSRAESQK